METSAFLRSISLKHDSIDDYNSYPFSIPAINQLVELDFSPTVTFIVGENGSGKSTIIEAIAVALGFNPEGGTKNFTFETHANHSDLHKHLRLVRSPQRPSDGFFLRAESFYNLATTIERLDINEPGDAAGPPIIDSYGGQSLHGQSHGESFLSLMIHRFSGNGLYIDTAVNGTKQNESASPQKFPIHYRNAFADFNGLSRCYYLSNHRRSF